MKDIFELAPEPYLPEMLPLKGLNEMLRTDEIIDLMNEASAAFGTYNGFLQTAINPLLLISPLIMQESVLSSKLEGTHATLEDFLAYDAGNETSVSKDEMHEIANYRMALYHALDKMGTIDDTTEGKYPLSSRIIKEMHKILLSNVRGSSKRPGEFKQVQNYIGSSSGISFTPVPPDKTLDYMFNLEQYIHMEQRKVIVQAAVIHAQFEMIHPFEDGNGRIGRLLIPLFLYYRNKLPYPTFYMSAYFEKDRDLYLKNLKKISEDGDWATWITYFLEGIIEQSSINTLKAKKLLAIYEYLKEDSREKIKSRHTIDVIDFIFEHPVFKAKQLKNKLSNTSDATVYNLLSKFVDYGYLEKTDEKRNTTYICKHIVLAM